MSFFFYNGIVFSHYNLGLNVSLSRNLVSLKGVKDSGLLSKNVR